MNRPEYVAKLQKMVDDHYPASRQTYKDMIGECTTMARAAAFVEAAEVLMKRGEYSATAILHEYIKSDMAAIQTDVAAAKKRLGIG